MLSRSLSRERRIYFVDIKLKNVVWSHGNNPNICIWCSCLIPRNTLNLWHRLPDIVSSCQCQITSRQENYLLIIFVVCKWLKHRHYVCSGVKRHSKLYRVGLVIKYLSSYISRIRDSNLGNERKILLVWIQNENKKGVLTEKHWSYTYTTLLFIDNVTEDIV